MEINFTSEFSVPKGTPVFQRDEQVGKVLKSSDKKSDGTYDIKVRVDSLHLYHPISVGKPVESIGLSVKV